MKVQEFYDASTYTLTYIVYDEATKDAIVIDPVLNYEPNSGSYSFESMQKILDFMKGNELNVHFIIETHAHADHLTSSYFVKSKWPNAKVAIGKNITKVQSVFKDVFNLKEFIPDGSQFDVLLADNEETKAGNLSFKTIFTPGHTPACTSILVGDALFTGDTIFMPDYGTGRCDFPAGSAEDLYESITQKIYTLPEDTRIFVGHDYCPNGRELAFQTTVGESKKSNIRLTSNTTKEEFVKFRSERDATLSAPRLLLQSIQINIQAGKLPEAEDNGMRYLKLPLKTE
ncbi:MAG: MBL fold metallo-hydrolase [Halobacteriovoraceae bacterium]|nr:MBL fold metallo-hydrolase [Halobacteriovoraceae bacterium]